MSVVVALLLFAAACTSTQTVRLTPQSVHVSDQVRPSAGIQTNATSLYVFFIPIPGVDLDKVVNQMLIATAKAMGADKIADLRFEATPETGIWALRKLLGWRSAEASGIAVQVTSIAPDPNADDGPEPAANQPENAPTSAPMDDELGAEGP